MKERYLTVDQVAQEMSSNSQAVRRLLRLGMLRGARTGNGDKSNPWRVPESALAEYWEARSNKKPTDTP